MGRRQARRVAKASFLSTPAGIDVDDTDQIKVKDGSVVTGTLPKQHLPFKSSFGVLTIDSDDVAGFANVTLNLKNGTVLKGRFGEGKLAVTTGLGRVEVPLQDIVVVKRGGAAGSPQKTAASGPSNEQVLKDWSAYVAKDAQCRALVNAPRVLGSKVEGDSAVIVVEAFATDAFEGFFMRGPCLGISNVQQGGSIQQSLAYIKLDTGWRMVRAGAFH